MVVDLQNKFVVSKNAPHGTGMRGVLFLHIPNRKEPCLEYMVLTFVSVALLLTVVSFIKERRLRLALQGILRHLIQRWRAHGKTDSTNHTNTDPVDRSRL
ncbi:hypothetical protein V6x_53950 [Gimesia chilikensis]|uniref:Uncharacterized protein n=1 Tax=Gimesia chilikensis TaxID=2605989 RepID=A0A517WK69_9PLAN|nr:hypothetical protein V6x_53950 [Gimesia chilikensis]